MEVYMLYDSNYIKFHRRINYGGSGRSVVWGSKWRKRSRQCREDFRVTKASCGRPQWKPTAAKLPPGCEGCLHQVPRGHPCSFSKRRKDSWKHKQASQNSRKEKIQSTVLDLSKSYQWSLKESSAATGPKLERWMGSLWIFLCSDVALESEICDQQEPLHLPQWPPVKNL